MHQGAFSSEDTMTTMGVFSTSKGIINTSGGGGGGDATTTQESGICLPHEKNSSFPYLRNREASP